MRLALLVTLLGGCGRLGFGEEPVMPPEIDHVPMISGSVDIVGSVQDCSVPHVRGIDGNDNVLVLGGSLMIAPDADPDPTPDAVFQGAIDHVHLRSSWRDFSSY